mgnify:CR=1 FL=1
MLAVVVPFFACFNQEELVAVGRWGVADYGCAALGTTWAYPCASLSFLKCLVLSTSCFTIALLVAMTVLVLMGSYEGATGSCGRQVAWRRLSRVGVATS